MGLGLVFKHFALAFILSNNELILKYKTSSFSYH
jgi:hypothetical protein